MAGFERILLSADCERGMGRYCTGDATHGGRFAIRLTARKCVCRSRHIIAWASMPVNVIHELFEKEGIELQLAAKGFGEDRGHKGVKFGGSL
jgi:hypothetical protein